VSTLACAKTACFETGGERWLYRTRRVMLGHIRRRLLGPERAWQTRGRVRARRANAAFSPGASRMRLRLP
jgi:hypothetical protein